MSDQTKDANAESVSSSASCAALMTVDFNVTGNEALEIYQMLESSDESRPHLSIEHASSKIRGGPVVEYSLDPNWKGVEPRLEGTMQIEAQ